MKSMLERQKAEAVLRLELMGVREDVRRQFQEDGTVMLSNLGRYQPITKTMMDEVRQFEQEHDATVFLAVRRHTAIGLLDALLFVGKYEEEWVLEQEDLKDGYAMSFCFNRDYPECSEMGSIFVRTTKDGCIVREG